MKIKNIITVVLLSLVCAQFSVFDREYTHTKEGVESFKKKDYEKALKHFENAALLNPDNPVNQFNKGTALAKQQNLDEAVKYFQKSAANEKADKTLRADAHYNLGNILIEQQKYSDAVNQYKNSLKLNPNHINAKYNLTYAYNMLQSQQNQKSDNQKKDESDEKNNKNDKNEKQNKDNQEQKNDKDNQQQGAQNEKPENPDKERAEQLLQSIINSNKSNDQKNENRIILKGAGGKAW